MAKWLLPLLAALCLVSLNGEGKKDKPDVSPPSRGITMTVTFLEGEVSIDEGSAEIGQTVPYGATVSTGPSGFCEIQFADRNIIRIEADTTTRLNIKSKEGEIDLEKGQMALLLEKLDALLLDDNEAFTLNTSIAAAGIRGTAFFVKVESEDSVYLCCCNGSIEMEDREGATPYGLSSAHHQAVRFTRDSGQYRAEAAPLLYHDDEGMDHLADQIGYTIPWDTSYGAY